MSAQHTPGPWTVEATPHSSNQNFVVKAGRSRISVYTDSDEADARLIAAAPDLLAIAERLALATTEGDDLAHGTHYVDKAGRIRCKGSFLALIEDARAAIAKATGGAAS